VVLAFLGGCYALFAYLMQIGVNEGYEPVQPIHFSHKIHAGDNQIDCQYCHSGARSSAMAALPSLINVPLNILLTTATIKLFLRPGSER